MIGAEGVLADPQGPLEHGFRFGIPAVDAVKGCKVIQAGREVRVLGT
jgi:hypothetical protein